MRWIFRKLIWCLAIILLGVLLLLAPVGYNELACRPGREVASYEPILPKEDWRPESSTLLTYPEWHIVHAYDDYGRVISENDPHDFGYFTSISGFWSSLCELSKTSGEHGGFPWETKQTIYTIGVSFTAELLAKAAYEETLGRIATWIRGPKHSELDEISAQQAKDYARFLQQVPWYEWDFTRSAQELTDAAGNKLRNSERRFALGTEYRVKAIYAQAIKQAVAQIGADELRLRMIVRGISQEELARFEDVDIIATRPEGVEIETPRYRQLTHLIENMAAEEAQFVEIAGNDDILLTVISEQPEVKGAIFSFRRQGYDDWRHLILTKVENLGELLQSMPEKGLTLEHIHDY